MNHKEQIKLFVSILAVLPVLVLGINIIEHSPKTALASIAEVRNS
jgi:hypothetical protein